jgi:hypothetical protein
MTDQEKLAALLTEFGVEFKEKKRDNTVALRCRQVWTKVEGYCFFYTEFIFNLDGSFNHMGAWE